MLVWLIINDEYVLSLKVELSDEALAETSVAKVKLWFAFMFVEKFEIVVLGLVVSTKSFVVLSWYETGVVVSEKAWLKLELEFKLFEYLEADDDVIELFIISVVVCVDKVVVSFTVDLTDVNNGSDDELFGETSVVVETWAEVKQLWFEFVFWFVEGLELIVLEFVIVSSVMMEVFVSKKVFVALSWYKTGVVVAICEDGSDSSVDSDVEKASLKEEFGVEFKLVEYLKGDDVVELFIIIVDVGVWLIVEFSGVNGDWAE